MKNEKKSESTNKKQAGSRFWKISRLWKIVAISMIIIFAVFVAAGLLKDHKIKSSFKKPTQEQVDYATKIAAEQLNSEGVNASSLDVQSGMMMRRVRDSDLNRNVMQVSFSNDSAIYTYLVDVDSGEVLMHSNTYRYGRFGGAYDGGKVGYAMRPSGSARPSCGFEKEKTGCNTHLVDEGKE